MPLRRSNILGEASLTSELLLRFSNSLASSTVGFRSGATSMMRTWTSSCLANRSRAFSISKGSPSRATAQRAVARSEFVMDQRHKAESGHRGLACRWVRTVSLIWVSADGVTHMGSTFGLMTDRLGAARSHAIMLDSDQCALA